MYRRLKEIVTLVSSVVDPDTEPYVSGPPGSGSVPKCHGSTTLLVRKLGVALEKYPKLCEITISTTFFLHLSS
jgi:hypothetical protein